MYSKFANNTSIFQLKIHNTPHFTNIFTIFTAHLHYYEQHYAHLEEKCNMRVI